MKRQFISTMDDLQNTIMSDINRMVDTLAERVYQTLNYFLKKYYDSYSPISYRRMYDYLHSAIKVDSRMKGNKAEAYVYIDYESMKNYKKVSGLQVAIWANEGLHGGMPLGEDTPHVWDDTIDETVKNGELLKAAIQYLKSRGIMVEA